MRLAITGATGLLGRNVIFEFVKQYANRLDDLEIVVLGRGTPTMPLADRVHELFESDGRFYLHDSGISHDTVAHFLRERVRCVPFDLDATGNPAHGIASLVGPEPVDYFIHSAALLDFRDGEGAERSRRRVNVDGTARVLDLVSALRVRRFAYVGSAYACGLAGGVIPPDRMDFAGGFRNPYERTKLQAEAGVRAFERTHETACFYFRPSTISGRLIEPIVGMTPKFDVFYAWAAFFLRLKQKGLGPEKDLFDTPLEVPLRTWYRTDAGLNIVPADYAAKAIYWTLRLDRPGSYHLVNREETPHKVYIPLMLKALNVLGVTRVDEMPSGLNAYEGIYYKTVGKLYTPYIINDPLLFDIANLEEVHRVGNIRCPEVDAARFERLMAYAVAHNFGLTGTAAVA